MTTTRFILVISFLLAFAAGLVVGRLTSEQRLQADRPPSRMAEELDLTPEQRERISAIWEAMRPLGLKHREARNEARQQRDVQVRDLLSEHQLQEFERFQEAFRQANEAIDAERRAAFEQAREQTKAILTEAQREKFDRMFRDRPRGGEDRERGGPGFRGEGPRRGPGGPERPGPGPGPDGDRELDALPPGPPPGVAPGDAGPN